MNYVIQERALKCRVGYFYDPDDPHSFVTLASFAKNVDGQRVLGMFVNGIAKFGDNDTVFDQRTGKYLVGDLNQVSGKNT